MGLRVLGVSAKFHAFMPRSYDSSPTVLAKCYIAFPECMRTSFGFFFLFTCHSQTEYISTGETSQAHPLKHLTKAQWSKVQSLIMYLSV